MKESLLAPIFFAFRGKAGGGCNARKMSARPAPLPLASMKEPLRLAWPAEELI
jgi:hypothetical protein